MIKKVLCNTPCPFFPVKTKPHMKTDKMLTYSFDQ